jgi:hypothetical protein
MAIFHAGFRFNTLTPVSRRTDEQSPRRKVSIFLDVDLFWITAISRLPDQWKRFQSARQP